MAEEESNSSESEEDGEPEEAEARDGAVAIIRNKSEDAGETEFYFEVKDEGYFIDEYVGKANLVGGAIEDGESPLEALLREVDEEFENPEAAEIVKKNVKGKYGIVKGKVPGYKEGRVHVYEVVIEDPEEWEKVKNSRLKGDGDSTLIKRASDLTSLEFAWGYEVVLEPYLKEELGVSVNLRRGSYGSFSLEQLLIVEQARRLIFSPEKHHIENFYLNHPSSHPLPHNPSRNYSYNLRSYLTLPGASSSIHKT